MTIGFKKFADELTEFIENEESLVQKRIEKCVDENKECNSDVHCMLTGQLMSLMLVKNQLKLMVKNHCE